jgi:hypothetical protein
MLPCEVVIKNRQVKIHLPMEKAIVQGHILDFMKSERIGAVQ